MGLRVAQLLVVLTGAVLAAGCSIDGIEWESTGLAVDTARHALEEEHHVEGAAIECIKREAAGLAWECRAAAGEEHYHCKIHFGVRQEIRAVHCEQEHEEEAGHEEEAEHEEDEAEAPHEEEAPAEE